MKICFISEGCYPYVVGGVSSWIHSMISSFPEHEYSLVSVVSDRSLRGKFAYRLPDNLVSVSEVYLNDMDWVGKTNAQRKRRVRMNNTQRIALTGLVAGDSVDWEGVFSIFRAPDLSVDTLLMSPEFLNVVMELYSARYPTVPFTDFLWTLRSIYLTLFIAMKFVPPKADIYHCVATGYAGIIGSMAKLMYPDSRLLISEHGIYTREREEEIIRAKWVQGIFKDLWIDQFRKMSSCAYQYADCVTALFVQAHYLQLELGCPADKAIVIPNGIRTETFENLPQKEPDDDGIHVGAILRVTPIKDVKTMITAFHYAQLQNPRLHLWIMGPSDEDPTYARECHELVDSLKAKNITFTGSIRTTEYIGKMDMTLLTSISEGQPLTILEGFAAGKPCVATNVGNCFGLINGEDDDFGPAGLICPVMSIPEISKAILTMAADMDECRRMGEVGRQRVLRKYKISDMRNAYKQLYSALRLGKPVTPLQA